MLSLIREMEKQKPSVQIELVKVHKVTAAVYEAENFDATIRYTAQENDEYPIVDQRDQWYQISLPDGRTGWIHEDAVQVITAAVTEAAGLSASRDSAAGDAGADCRLDGRNSNLSWGCI